MSTSLTSCIIARLTYQDQHTVMVETAHHDSNPNHEEVLAQMKRSSDPRQVQHCTPLSPIKTKMNDTQASYGTFSGSQKSG